jgi:LacI family transcriptional regulator
VEQLIVTNPQARVSVTQIAARAGVSIATVSRVLNNTRRVNPDIVAQVRKAMIELRYSPRGTRRKKSGADTARKRIAIVSLGGPYREWFEMPVMASVVAEITRAAQADHLSVLMTEMPDPAKLTPILRHREIDGALVFIHSTFDASAAGVLARQVPVVRVMGGQLAPVEIDHVGPDNNAIGYLAASHLRARGCRDVAFLTTQPTWDLNKLRAQGFAAGGHAMGLKTVAYVVGQNDELAQICGPETRGFRGLAPLVDELVAQRPHGLFVSRDEELVAVYRLLAEHGVRPGRDLEIVSCDNENVRLSMLDPRPASIEIGTAELALRAVRRLEGRMKQPDEPPVRILVTPRLVLPPKDGYSALSGTGAATT